MSPMLLLGIFLIANFFLSMKFNFDLSGAQALLRIIFQLFSLSLLIIGLHGGVQVRLLVYGALVYLAWEIVLPWLGWEFWKERGKFNSFFFGYLPDYNGVMMSAWFSFILVLMVISTLRALRCLRSDLVQMSVNPTPEIPEEEFARPGWDQAEK